MKQSSLRCSSRPALGIAMAIGLATFVPGALAQAPEAREQPTAEMFEALFQQRPEASQAAPREEELSAAEVEGVVQVLRERDLEERKRAETATADDIVGGVSVVARCAEGWIASTNIRKSATDVEILSEERVACDESGCKAVQVNARRATEDPFTLVVSIACNG